MKAQTCGLEEKREFRSLTCYLLPSSSSLSSRRRSARYLRQTVFIYLPMRQIHSLLALTRVLLLSWSVIFDAVIGLGLGHSDVSLYALGLIQKSINSPSNRTGETPYMQGLIRKKGLTPAKQHRKTSLFDWINPKKRINPLENSTKSESNSINPIENVLILLYDDIRKGLNKIHQYTRSGPWPASCSRR